MRNFYVFKRIYWRYLDVILHRKYKVDNKCIMIVMADRDAGFFSLFFQVVGLADFCLKNNCNYRLDFSKAPYTEEGRGDNWWVYYFESNEFSSCKEVFIQKEVTTLKDQHDFSNYGKLLSPQDAHRVIVQSGMQIKEEIRAKVSSFYNDNLSGKYVIGLHYRGLDKVSGDGKESTRIPYDYVLKCLNECDASALFFVATDEAPLMDYLLEKFPNRIIYYDSIRSVNDVAIHHGGVEGASMYKAGQDALIDCVLLSRCDFLIRSDSNLSLACSFFNPDLKTSNLTDRYQKDVSGR